jgi:cytochrome P450
LSETAVTPNHPDSPAAWKGLFEWVQAFTGERRRAAPKGDVVDAIVGAEIEGRPIDDDEVIGLVLLLILGGLDTTTGALGQIMLRFCREPAIPQLLRERPDQLDDAVEELLRLEGPFISVARTATRDVELGGQLIRAGDKVLFYWSSANRDPEAFEDPDVFRLDRDGNRHLAFGIGPHRCTGSNVARMNLRVSVLALANRLQNLELTIDEGEVHWHSVHNRAPLGVPIRFTPGARIG